MPPADSPADYQDIDDNSIDHNEYPVENEKDSDSDGDNLRKEVEMESVIIIVLASLLFTLLFFAGLIFYYARGKSYLKNFAGGRKWSSDFR